MPKSVISEEQRNIRSEIMKTFWENKNKMVGKRKFHVVRSWVKSKMSYEKINQKINSHILKYVRVVGID